MIKKKYIVAGNYHQFMNYVKDNTEQDIHYIYVSGINTIRGIHDPSGVFVGTWYERPDMDEILNQLKVACFNYEAIERAYHYYLEKKPNVKFEI